MQEISPIYRPKQGYDGHSQQKRSDLPLEAPNETGMQTVLSAVGTMLAHRAFTSNSRSLAPGFRTSRRATRFPRSEDRKVLIRSLSIGGNSLEFFQ